MKNILPIALLGFFMLSGTAQSCDERCLKEKAESKHNITYPKYLTWEYCQDLTTDFMSSAMRSLDSYRSKHFSTKFKGPLKNTRNYLSQRKEWLRECDGYLNATKDTHLFKDGQTTKQIFSAIEKVENEFDALISGATYASATEAKAIMDEKINTLLKHVDDHRDFLTFRGRYVVR